jgi:thioredoxin-dependent peroxiredoxin
MARMLGSLAVMLLGSVLMTPAFADELKVGDKAPDFKLQGSDGKIYSLADLKGKTVVLAWFPKAFTGG